MPLPSGLSAIAGLTAAQIGALAGKGIDAIDASDDLLALSVAQYTALGAVTLTAGDTVTLADTGAAIKTADANGLLLQVWLTSF